MCEIATKFVRFMDVCFVKLVFRTLFENGPTVPKTMDSTICHEDFTIESTVHLVDL